MWADMVVPAAKQAEIVVELREVGHLPLVELLFERTEETLDSAVLPWAVGIGTLVADTQPLESEAKFTRGKNGCVVGSDDLRFAVGANDFVQTGDQRSRGLVPQCVQMQQRTAAVIQNAEQRMEASLGIGLAGEIQRPDEVARHVHRPGVFEPAAQHLDFIAMPLQGLMDEGLANGNVAGSSKPAVADVGDGAASGLGHEGFEAEDFVLEPGRLLRGMAVAVANTRRESVPSGRA